jgi:large subunit ribosomal protein L17
MRHGDKRSKLGRTAEHRKAMLRNLATAILKKGTADEQVDRYITTTVHKAKAVRSMVERLITYAKKGDLAARRQAARFIQEPAVLQSLFSDLAPKYKNRQGGYTRVLKLSNNRLGDNAEMAVIGLVEADKAE